MWSIFVGIFLVTVTCLFVFWKTKRNTEVNQSQNADGAKSILIVVGSGGHTREILYLAKALGESYQPRYYVVAETDKMSEAKIINLEKEGVIQHKILKIPRSREVKQSYFTSIITTVNAVLYCVPLVLSLRPDIILCNGPGTCIPVCFAGILQKLLKIKRTMLIYVESVCRVKSLSLSGKILYHFADHLFVQWPDLLEKYPKAKYLGRLV